MEITETQTVCMCVVFGVVAGNEVESEWMDGRDKSDHMTQLLMACKAPESGPS